MGGEGEMGRGRAGQGGTGRGGAGPGRATLAAAVSWSGREITGRESDGFEHGCGHAGCGKIEALGCRLSPRPDRPLARLVTLSGPHHEAAMTPTGLHPEPTRNPPGPR